MNIRALRDYIETCIELEEIPTFTGLNEYYELHREIYRIG